MRAIVVVTSAIIHTHTLIPWGVDFDPGFTLTDGRSSLVLVIHAVVLWLLRI